MGLTTFVAPELALPGRSEPLHIVGTHTVLGVPLTPPFPERMRQVQFGMGCFWGAERRFWSQPGVYTTAVGYAGGQTPNPTYEEVCTGRTNHAEVVLVVYDPEATSLAHLLAVFWQSHDPTQGMRQGADIGTQYRSVIYLADSSERAMAIASRDTYQAMLKQARVERKITTHIDPWRPFYYAEDYHQQYLQKNPNGYCGLGGTGVACDASAFSAT